MQLFIKLHLGVAPVALEASRGDMQDFRSLFLGKALVIEQVKQRFFDFWQTLDGLVKVFPFEKAFGW